MRFLYAKARVGVFANASEACLPAGRQSSVSPSFRAFAKQSRGSPPPVYEPWIASFLAMTKWVWIASRCSQRRKHSKPARTEPVRSGGLKTNQGFTLIELLVVTGVIIVVSGVVLANQNKFGGQVLLQNFAYDVALSIRQAQVYGLAVARSGSGSSATFGTSYGIHFDIDDSKVSHLFADIDKNGIETVSEGERVQTMNIRRGFYISDLSINLGGTSDPGKNSVDIIFQRPEPDAKISWTDGTVHNCILGDACATATTITLKSPRNDYMQVTVDLNGQISVSKP